jgi:hypothetical protein
MYRLNHHAYCGMSGIADTFEDSTDARKAAARRIRDYRASFKVTTLERGERWEVLEPEDSVMVPDACGTLVLQHETFECRECGNECETSEAAFECCAESDEWPDAHHWRIGT